METKQSSHFLVPVIEDNKLIHYVDLNSTYTFKDSNIPHNLAEHGLCQQLNRLVLRSDGYPLKVYKSREELRPLEPPKKPQTINVPYIDWYKVKKVYTFNRLEIDEAQKILKQSYNKEETAKRIARRIGAPIDAIQKLMYKISSIDKLIRSKKKKTSKLKKGGKKNVTTTSVKTVKKRK